MVFVKSKLQPGFGYLETRSGMEESDRLAFLARINPTFIRMPAIMSRLAMSCVSQMIALSSSVNLSARFLVALTHSSFHVQRFVLTLQNNRTESVDESRNKPVIMVESI